MSKIMSEVVTALSKKGYNSITGDYYTQIQKWADWFRGNVNDFHYYNVKLSNGSTKQVDRKTLAMAKDVSNEWSSYLDKFEINISNKKVKDYVLKVLDDNNFDIEFSNICEFGFALGTSAMVQFVKDGKIEIDYLTGDVVIPINWKGSKITELATISQSKDGDYTINHLTYHIIENGKYYVRHEFYKSKDETELGELFTIDDEEFENEVAYETNKPFFQVIKPNIANNLDFRNPMGVSIYANAIDILKSIDEKYDSFAREFKMGKRRILVQAEATKKDIDDNGNVVSYFDFDDEVFQSVTADMGEKPIQDIAFDLRVQPHIDGINADLHYLSYKCGFGSNFYEFDGNKVERTATEVLSENSELYNNKLSHEKIIGKAIIDLIESIIFLGVELGDISMPSKIDVKVEFDKSIVEDKAKEIDTAIKEMTAGVMSKKTYLMNIKGLTEQEAEEELEKIKDDNKLVGGADIDFFGNTNEEEEEEEVEEVEA